ncbi:MAG: NCS2 family permease [Erysipelotrichaceae bacterium]
MEKFFKVLEHKSSIKTELIAGVTTFLAMAYILFVNSGIVAETGLPFTGIFVATALSAAVTTLFMGLYANLPIALAPGMGLNAVFTYTLVLTMGMKPESALAVVFLSGIVGVLVSVTPLRKMVVDAIPKALKLAIGAGIGFFIAFIGLKNAGIIVANPATYVALGDVKAPLVVLALAGLLLTIILLAKKVPAAIFLGIIGTAVMGVIAGLFGLVGMPTLPTAVVSANLDFSLVGLFVKGFQPLFADYGITTIFVVVFSLFFVDFFDTAGTFVAVSNSAGLLDKDGNIENVSKAFIVDSSATVVGAVLGTPNVTSYIESGAGVEVGGRTGLTAVVVGVLFLLSLFFSPLLSVVTSAVTAPALIVVGVLMAQQLGGIKWDDLSEALLAFLVVISMALTYSISTGIAFGFILYPVLLASTGKFKQIKPILWFLLVVSVLFFIR